MTTPSDSILGTSKKVLGLDPEDPSFDVDLVMHINTILGDLTQIGVGPAEGFAIADGTETWENFIGQDPTLNSVKTYVYLRLRLVFDPPPTSFAINSFKEQIDKHEWRLSVRADEINHPPLPPEVIEP